MNTKYEPSRKFEELRELLGSLPDSPGVLRLNCEISGHPAFFPGGHGYKGPSFPESPIMFIGHNFDTDEGFRLSVIRGFEDHFRIKTWVNMRGSFLAAARIDEDRCFFSNFYLGAIVSPRSESGQISKFSNTGAFKCSREYRTACVEALKTQVRIVRPRVIALLGANVSAPFGKAFSPYEPNSHGKLEELQKKQPVTGYRLRLLPDLDVQVVSLAHPANPRSLESHRAQGLLLASAVQAADQNRI